MSSKFFTRLLESVKQGEALIRNAKIPARVSKVDAISVKEIRAATQLSQAKFADLIQVEVSTLRNWEQGRRAPTGAARALLRAIRNDPSGVLNALNADVKSSFNSTLVGRGAGASIAFERQATATQSVKDLAPHLVVGSFNDSGNGLGA